MKYINQITKVFTLLLMTSFLFASCNEDLVMDVENQYAPSIVDFSPKTGDNGTLITLIGENIQKLDSVWIGDGVATVKYLINTTTAVVVVNKSCTTGKVRIKNDHGEFTSVETFSRTFAVPTINDFPTSAKVNDQILIEGENLQVVTELFFGTVKGEILSQDNATIVAKVPFFEGGNAKLAFVYYDGVENKEIKPASDFSLIDLPPTVTQFPITGLISSSIIITGTNLNLITEVTFGPHKGTIVAQSATQLDIMIPTNFEENTIVPLQLIYSGGKSYLVTETFEVTVPIKETILYWANKTLYCQDPANTDNFFNAYTGEIYTPCDYSGVKNNITFFFTNSSSSIQLNNPNNSDQQLKNFKCEGVGLPVEKGVLIVKFRALKADVAADNVYIEKVKNKTLKTINNEMLVAEGVLPATTSAFRYYGTAQDMFAEGTVVLFQQFNGTEVIKVGFLEILKITTTNAATDKTSSVKFNCYFQN